MRALDLGSWFGIRVGVDPSWLLVFGLSSFGIAGAMREGRPEWSEPLVWGVAVACSLLFFLSLLLHEFGHSLTANALGVPIRSITLFVFGGVAAMKRDPSRPRDEFLIAVMGPAVSVALAIAFFFAAEAAAPPGLGFLDEIARHRAASVGEIVAPPPVESIPVGREALVETLTLLWAVNATLVVFNCFPGFPLDGGRILRSILWAATGNYGRSTALAAVGGKAFALLLMLWGGWTMYSERDFVRGFWLVAIGWFLMKIAKASVANARVQEALASIPAGRFMAPGAVRVAGSAPLAELADGPLVRSGFRTFLAETEGRVRGVLAVEDVFAFSPALRERIRTIEAAEPLDPARGADVSEDLWSLVQRLEGRLDRHIAVTRDGEIVGAIDRRTLAEAIPAIARGRA